ncbi:MAG: prolipoprotein diacylglyceryl transferase [Niabella sp.]
MYPNLYYLFREVLGIEWPFLQYITTLGTSIALAFVFGMYYLRKDLVQKEALGYYRFQKNTLLNPVKPAKELPSKTLGTIALLNTICGIVIGKIFYLFENSNELHNVQSILSLAGINYFGALTGMLVSSTVYYYRNNINPLSVFDSAAPGFILSYCIGRLGCHVSGDGDWGIVNTKPNPISWLPDWFWAYDYPHNIAGQGIIMNYCDWGNYCYKLSDPVFPTSLYEAIVCFLLFILLWRIRKKTHPAGFVMSIYLILSGIERFLVEEIRVNPIIKGWDITQAQLVSIIFILTGTTILSRIAFQKG